MNHYLVLTIAIILGYFFKGYGGKHKKRKMEIIGWIMLVVPAILMVVLKFGYKI